MQSFLIYKKIVKEFNNLTDRSSEISSMIAEAKRTKDRKLLEKILLEFKILKVYVKFLIKYHHHEELPYCKLFRVGLELGNEKKPGNKYIGINAIYRFVDEDDIDQIIDICILKCIRRFQPTEYTNIKYITLTTILRVGRYLYSTMITAEARKSVVMNIPQNVEMKDILTNKENFYLEDFTAYSSYLTNNWNVAVDHMPAFKEKILITYRVITLIRYYLKSTLK